MLAAFLAELPWATITPVTTMATFTGLVWAGKLVPRSWVDKTTHDLEERVRFLQESNEAQAETIASLTQQTRDLGVSGELSVALLRSLQDLNHTNHARAIEPGGGSAVVPSKNTE
jgi:hypothetical protein